MIGHYLDPRSLTRIAGFVVIALGVAMAAASPQAFNAPQWHGLIVQLVGPDKEPFDLIWWGVAAIGLKAAISKGFARLSEKEAP